MYIKKINILTEFCVSGTFCRYHVGKISYYLWPSLSLKPKVGETFFFFSFWIFLHRLVLKRVLGGCTGVNHFLLGQF